MSGSPGLGYPRRMTPAGFVMWLREFVTTGELVDNISTYGKPRVRVPYRKYPFIDAPDGGRYTENPNG